MTKGNYRTVVMRQHVRHREIRLSLALLAIGLPFALGYYLGQLNISPAVPSVPEVGTDEQLLALKDEFEVQQVQHQLDVATLEIVRKEIATQKEQVAQLEEGLQFYKSLMAPEEIAQGLSLRKLELVATETSDRFVFRLVAQQESLKHPLLKGSLSIELIGRENGEEVSYPLAALSEEIEGNSVALRFRYFQSVEGELVIPANFEPKVFSVIARANSPRKAEIQAQFPWEVQGRFSYVGE